METLETAGIVMMTAPTTGKSDLSLDILLGWSAPLITGPDFRMKVTLILFVPEFWKK